MGRSSGNEKEQCPPAVSVAAFGKHPGWDDHIADIGLDTETLAGFKRRLYFGGIGANIDAGTWERIPEPQRVADFHHAFLSIEPGLVLVGRLWASSDGKGRKRYPMIVCAQCAEMALPWLLDVAGARLRDVEEQCRSTTSASVVRSIMGAARDDLASAVLAARDGDALLPPWFVDGCGADRLAELGENGSGFARVFYKMEREMAAFLAPDGATPANEAPAQHIRVPLAGETEAASFAIWAGVLLTLVRVPARLFLVRHVEKTWIDIIVGEPRPPQFFCLLAAREALPSASDIPYSLDDAFKERAAALLAAWQQGNPDIRKGVLAAGSAPQPAGGMRRLFRGIFGGR